MPERTVHAVVLNRRDAGESDRRLTLLTLEEGKIDAIARGARKAGSRLAGSSDPLTASVMSLAYGRKALFVTQTQPLASFRGLRSDYDRLRCALAFVELCGAVLPYQEPAAECYETLLKFLAELESHRRPVAVLVWAELALLAISGFQPNFDACVDSGEPIGGSEAWLSPTAGGCLSAEAARSYPDRFRMRIEIARGLARTAELKDPPPNLKFAEGCLAALLPFWRKFAEAPLPANESLVPELVHAAESGST